MLWTPSTRRSPHSHGSWAQRLAERTERQLRLQYGAIGEHVIGEGRERRMVVGRLLPVLALDGGPEKQHRPWHRMQHAGEVLRAGNGVRHPVPARLTED